MARPMVLIQEDILSEMYFKYKQGVPVLALIRQYEMQHCMTAPTLTKLLNHLDAMESAVPEVAEIIYCSLFPQWLLDKEDELTIVTAPKTYYYSGKMPLGKWHKREVVNG